MGPGFGLWPQLVNQFSVWIFIFRATVDLQSGIITLLHMVCSSEYNRVLTLTHFQSRGILEITPPPALPSSNSYVEHASDGLGKSRSKQIACQCRATWIIDLSRLSMVGMGLTSLLVSWRVSADYRCVPIFYKVMGGWLILAEVWTQAEQLLVSHIYYCSELLRG
jgi:hypothetical protein